MSESLNQLLNQFVQNSFKMFRNETNDFMSESLICFYFSVIHSEMKHHFCVAQKTATGYSALTSGTILVGRAKIDKSTVNTASKCTT